eukprot:CAMPEP_0178440268 /NCGR_PEP_ID=MMETSP0689_2-20121128/36668_1 /TAXON_ID=160604 /ORGANISM="Amphidinium massartii, Strain CS-259" /LENGTH=826 /DNA_ID=CAMNT_0020062991 /DNA_START=66 /DNA_END=2546 /DNA_ORIENTATION=-
MGLLRSEEMSYGMLMLPVQEAKKYVELLSLSGNVQFEDMNAREMRRPYRKYIQRIEEMQRILRYLSTGIQETQGAPIGPRFPESFLKVADQFKLDDVERDLKEKYKQFVEFDENNKKLEMDRSDAVEELEVVKAALDMLKNSEPSAGSGLTTSLLEADAIERRLDHISGVLLKEDQLRFQRAILRQSRGNALVLFTPLAEKLLDPKTGKAEEKVVFVIYFQTSKDADAMFQKLVKTAQLFGVRRYPWPSDAAEARQRAAKLTQEVSDKDKALSAFKMHMGAEAGDLLKPTAAGEKMNPLIVDYSYFCIKEKSTYATLNLFSGEGLVVKANCWFPKTDEPEIRKMLASANALAKNQSAMLMPEAPKSSPPTFTRTNDFTQGWQDVIDTYGIPRYQEANPALLTTVTFPFIFGMMYGDVGHGTLLLCAGIWLCKNASWLKESSPDIAGARFMILEMGIFAVFAGFMYNDFFSVGLPIFESRWEPIMVDGKPTSDYQPKAGVDTINSGEGIGPYPIGLDWAWHGATNELLFTNSLKMKLSVLFGVLQMIVGVFLRFGNALHEKNMVDLVFECVPMLIFMVCFFGWMDFMILYKWVTPDFPAGAPSVINSLIVMAMGGEDKQPLWDGSTAVMKNLMTLTVAVVPLMLFPKPLILLAQHKAQEKKKKAAGSYTAVGDEAGALEEAVEENGGGGHGHGHGEEFEFGEVFIHQIIETIEYVLGTVSHTASYLRIWALSLAHQQLSLVFFQKTLIPGLSMSGSLIGQAVALYLGFGAWFGITVAVLMGMDVLECFLHTLRLHWVEFDSKFYKADGYKFEPFSLRTRLTEDWDWD